MRAFLSIALGIGGLLVAGAGMSNLLDAGTCATGGPFEIAAECPEGSGWAVAKLVGGFLIWMVGLFISEGGLVEPGAGQIVWTLGFAGGGLALLIKGLTDPSLGPGSELGIYIMAAVLIPIGLVVAGWGLVQLRRGRRAGPESPPPI